MDRVQLPERSGQRVMAVYRSDPAVLAGYARIRYLTGVRLVDQHVRVADTARCASCGAVSPCRGAAEGAQLRDVYADWAEPVPPRRLVRPYIRDWSDRA